MIGWPPSGRLLAGFSRPGRGRRLLATGGRRRMLSLAGVVAPWFAAALAAAEPGEPGLKHLFVDTAGIAALDNLTRVLHHPQPHPGGPVLIGDQPWERWNIGVNGRCVLWDEERSLFRMWYGVYYHDATVLTATVYRICYAESKDGLHWTRPALGQSDWGAIKDTNLLKAGNAWMRRPNIIQDLRDPDEARRFKMTYVDIFGGRLGIAKGYSADGITWRLNVDGAPWFRGGDHSSNLLGWDDSIGRFVFFPRITVDGRIGVGRSTSLNFTEWSDPEVVLQPAVEEPHLAFKGNAAFFYEGLYLGFLWVFDKTGVVPGPNVTEGPTQKADVELVVSRDGISWQRAFPGRFFQSRGPVGSWDSEGLTPVAPIVHDDKIWIYYSGWNYPYGRHLDRVQEGWTEHGVKMQGAIGLATLRLDGFVSIRAGKTPGQMLTNPATVTGALMLNADVRGEMRVEITDLQGNPLEGFRFEDAEVMRGDGLRQRVRWRGGRTTVDLPAGTRVRLRFSLCEADLYSFWFTPPHPEPLAVATASLLP